LDNALNQVSEIARRRWLVALIVAVIGLILIPFAARSHASYTGSAELLIVSEALKDTTVSDPDLPSIVTSTEVLSKVIDKFHLDVSPIALAKQVKTKLPPKSSILQLSYKDTDPKRAADVTNAIADQAVLYFHDIATRGYNEVSAALDKRVNKSRQAIAATDSALLQTSADGGFESSDKALDDLTSRLDDLESQRGQLVSSLAADKAMADALHKQLNDIAPIARGEILQHDPVYQQVENGLGKDVADLASERSSFRDSFPGLKALVQRVQRENQQVAIVANVAVSNGAGESSSYTQTTLDSERAQADVASDQQRLAAIETELSDEKAHLRKVAGVGAEVATLRAERDAAVDQYSTLTQRSSAAQGDAAQAASLGSLVVVSRAIPGPSSITFFIAALVGLVIVVALAVAWLYDVLDRRFYSNREIERTYGRPVLLKVGGVA
jgi:uncharacterized protein involved in exopolysaccharide biosynthesis